MTFQAQILIPPGVLNAAEAFVKAELAAMDASHDYAHIQRVRANARNLAQLEGLDAEATALVDLAALLHDVRDWKYSGSDEATSEAVSAFLASQGVGSETIDCLTHIISRVGFKEELPTAEARPDEAGGDGASAAVASTVDNDNAAIAGGGSSSSVGLSREAAIVQDADRLDALGAIGIARCFTFGGAKHRELYDPAVPPREQLSKEQYMAGGEKATTINHFYEKLLKLKGLMKTAAGAHIAEGRHAFMEQYLRRFRDEWNGCA